MIAIEVLLRATLGTPPLFVLLGAKAVTAVLVFVAFLVTFRISGMSDVVAEVLADLAPRLHGPYVRIHKSCAASNLEWTRTGTSLEEPSYVCVASRQAIETRITHRSRAAQWAREQNPATPRPADGGTRTAAGTGPPRRLETLEDQSRDGPEFDAAW